MTQSCNANYVSPWLIHWTARTGGEKKGLANLKTIVKTRQLKLSCNRIYPMYGNGIVKTWMVCFTDVPLKLSQEHCARYGCFGIAFKKRKLILKGAQPVFYVTLGCRERVKDILHFLGDPSQRKDMPDPILEALVQHFCFIQKYSEGDIDAQDADYYEREWRLTKSTLAPEELWIQRDNPKYRIKQAGCPAYHGKLVVRNGKSFFRFDDADVAFLIAPASYVAQLGDTRGYKVHAYEDVVAL